MRTAMRNRHRRPCRFCIAVQRDHGDEWSMFRTQAPFTFIIPAMAAGLALTLPVVVAAVDVRVDFDKEFDFRTVRTWGWHPDGPGEVKMARTQADDPEAMRARAEPVIVEAVAAELSRRDLQFTTGTPDLFVTYYLLLTLGASAQTLGQFIPATPEWGLPPFAAATQSLEIKNQGSLVLDLSAAGHVVWRGVAQAKIKLDTSDEKRRALIRESVRDLLRSYPPKR